MSILSTFVTPPAWLQRLNYSAQ